MNRGKKLGLIEDTFNSESWVYKLKKQKDDEVKEAVISMRKVGS